jgi:hypothetical protein
MKKLLGLILCLFAFNLYANEGTTKTEVTTKNNVLPKDIISELQSKFPEPKVIDQKKFNNITVVHLSVTAADHSDAYAIITPQHKIIDIDDYAILSGMDIKKDPNYKDLAKKFPNIDSLWPGNHQYPESVNLPGGIQQLQFTYSILNGCHACELAAIGKVGFNFDGDGSYLGAQLLGLSPPPISNA